MLALLQLDRRFLQAHSGPMKLELGRRALEASSGPRAGISC
jgi:hypothetical protein